MMPRVAIRGMLAVVSVLAAFHLLGLWRAEDVDNFATFQLAIEWIMILFLVFDVLPSIINHLVKVPGTRSMLLNMTLIVGILLCITMAGQFNPTTDTTQVTILMLVMFALLWFFTRVILPRILAITTKTEEEIIDEKRP